MSIGAEVMRTSGSWFETTSGLTDFLPQPPASINSAARSGEDRVAINAYAPLNDYTVYFKNGRFYLVIPRGRLDGVEDGLRGRLFSDAMVEKHGDDLILSFLLQPGARASVAERGDGLDLIFVLAGNNRDRASSGLGPIAP